MKSTKLLNADHEVIAQGLNVLDEINMALEKGKDVPFDDIRSLLAFLREFADGCHHVKEEAIFFPALMVDGMAFDEASLRVMSYEHERGRALLSAMEDALGRNNKAEFLMYSKRYKDLLSEHLEKETWVLFEKADQILSDDEDQKIAVSLEHYNVIVGAPNHERWRRTLETLIAKYLHESTISEKARS
jgi:hemerythrin-like domain-containing protein